MSYGTRDLSPTPSAALELKDERELVREGYDFLDEKRLLLAGALLQELQRYEDRLAEFNALHEEAQNAIAGAMQRHGLHGIQVYPSQIMENAKLETSRRHLLGVILSESKLDLALHEDSIPAELPSPEANQCKILFGKLLRQAAVMAAITGNLFRLVAEYRRTQRRARALEDVLLPEIEEALRNMVAHLEDADLEEVIRARLKYKS